MPRRKILVIDNDPLIVKGLDILLKNAGYETHLSQDGHNVVTLVEKCKPDLVILDVMLGGPDGREIALTLKKTKSTSMIPVILISANHYMQENYVSYGADEFIAKPFDSTHLLMLVHKHCTECD